LKCRDCEYLEVDIEEVTYCSELEKVVRDVDEVLYDCPLEDDEQKCKTCVDFNKIKKVMYIETILIEGEGYFTQDDIQIMHCPSCGSVLDKYKEEKND